MSEKIMRVWLQLAGNRLHPVSRQMITTVRALGQQYLTQGVVLSQLPVPEQNLLHSGLDEILTIEGPGFGGFCPEAQTKVLCGLETPEILLFPATPEGRTLSAMAAARLKTGVTADCTALSFREDGRLLQTRPAFSGNRMATIVTETKPQIASLRFGMSAPEPVGLTRIQHISSPELPDYEMRWLDRSCQQEEKQKLILAVGGAVRQKQDLEGFFLLAQALGGELCCSRALVDRGWMPRSRQIGLSGRTVKTQVLAAFGISGSVQFQAGLSQVDRLIAVDLNPDTALMFRADLPIVGDLYEIAGAMKKLLECV